MVSVARAREELTGEIGGANPLFYAYCQLYWARLGSLVYDSVDPQKQLAAQPSEFPRLNTFELASEVSDKQASRIYMGSWVRIRDGDGRKEHQRQFLVRSVKRYEDCTDDTELLVGRWAAVTTNHCTAGMGLFVQEPGIGCHDQSAAIKMMEHKNAARHIHAVQKRRRQNAKNLTRLLSELPDLEDLKKAEPDILNNLQVDGRDIGSAAEEVRIAAKRESMEHLTVIKYRRRLYDEYKHVTGASNFAVRKHLQA